jgi:hypothetical protein
MIEPRPAAIMCRPASWQRAAGVPVGGEVAGQHERAREAGGDRVELGLSTGGEDGPGACRRQDRCPAGAKG